MSKEMAYLNIENGDSYEIVDGLVRNGLENHLNAPVSIAALSVKDISYSILTDKVLNASGAVSSVSGTAYTVTDYIPVEYGQYVSFKYSRARWGNQNWSFFDGSYNVLSHSGKTASSTTVLYGQQLRVPVNAKFFVVAADNNSQTSPPDIEVKVIDKYYNAIDTPVPSVEKIVPKASVEEETLTSTNSSSYCIGSSGVVTGVTSADYLVSEVSVSAGDVVNIRNCQSRYSNKMYAFYDVANHPISAKDRSDDNPHDICLLEVPYGAVKLVASGYSTYPVITRVKKLYSGNSFVWRTKKWTCLGDSITDSNNTRATKRYHDYISEQTGINVVNLGLSGTGFLLPYNSNPPFYTRVSDVPVDSDVVTIMGSGNDCNQTLGTVTDTGTSTVCGCINTTIDNIRSRIPGVNLGIITPTPWQPYPTTTPNNNMDKYSAAIVEICKLKGVPCLDLYHCSNLLPWDADFRTAFYSRDGGNGTHPDENGHAIFAPRIYAFLRTLLM